MNLESGLILAIAFCVTQSFGIFGLRQSVRGLERKLDALIKYQGIELPSRLSLEAQIIAQHPGRKIAAIKLHREQNPDLSLAEAKRDVEDCISGKQTVPASN